MELWPWRWEEVGGGFTEFLVISPHVGLSTSPRWICPAGTFAFPMKPTGRCEPMAACASRKSPPLAEKQRGAAIKTPTGWSELRITRDRDFTRHATRSDLILLSDRTWIILTMTLEEIRGQDNAMDNANRWVFYARIYLLSQHLWAWRFKCVNVEMRSVLMELVFLFVKGAKCRRSAGGAAPIRQEAGLPDSGSLRVRQSHECVSPIHEFHSGSHLFTSPP